MGENFLLHKHFEAYPRQMELDMRSLQALQVQASRSSCDISFNNLSSFLAVNFACQV